jgi:hypothetical protein
MNVLGLEIFFSISWVQLMLNNKDAFNTKNRVVKADTSWEQEPQSPFQTNPSFFFLKL